MAVFLFLGHTLEDVRAAFLFLGQTLEDVWAAFTCASHSWFFVSEITHRTVALLVWSISLDKIVGLVDI